MNLNINWGSPANEDIGVRGRFSLYAQKPSVAVYSPQMLQYENLLLDRISATVTPGVGRAAPEKQANIGGGYGSFLVDENLGTDVMKQIRLFTRKREQMTFEFLKDASVGYMTGDHSNLNYRLHMVNGSGNSVSTNPVYYDLYRNDGYVIRYSVSSGSVVYIRTASGRIITPGAATVGLDPIYAEDGSVRQLWSLSDGLADVVVTEPSVSYEIRCYAPEQVGSKTDGLYAVSGEPHTVWRVENPSPGSMNRVWITRTVNGVAELSQFEYSHNEEGWVLKRPDNLSAESKSTEWSPSRNSKIVTKVVRSGDGVVATRQNNTYQVFEFGERLVVNALDPAGANLRTVSTYYTDRSVSGSYSRKRSVTRSDGSWTMYSYDAQGRRALTVTPWKNSPLGTNSDAAQAEYLSYTPNDSRDSVELSDQRPRVREVKTLGITTAKTYSSWYFDNSCLAVVEEHCVNPAAAYGGATNLRTEERYYPAGDCTSPSAGRLHTATKPDGTRDTYTYEYGNYRRNADAAQNTFVPGSGNAVRMTVTHGTVDNPAGIAFKTTRDTIIYDERGCEVLTEKSVYTGSAYERFNWIAKTYDAQRRQLTELKSNGEFTEYTWNCCKKESETLPDGRQYIYTYDALKRMVAKTLAGHGNMPDYVTVYEYDAANRKVKETISGGDLSTFSTTQYNLAGQVVREVDHQGLITTFSYLPGVAEGSSTRGETTTTTLPGGAQQVFETACDQRITAQLGDAQTPQYYDYGVESDGKQWATVRTGGGDSPRYTRNVTDCVRRSHSDTNSGFGGDITTLYAYDGKGRRVSATETGRPVRYFLYDSIGNLIRNGYDFDGNGVLDLDSNDLIIDFESIYTVDDGGWHTTTEKCYNTIGDATATVNSKIRKRLGGFSLGVIEEKHYTDRYGNETQVITSVNREEKTKREYSIMPTSSPIIRMWKNGLLEFKVSSCNQRENYTYDALQRLSTLTDPRIGTTSLVRYSTMGKNGLIASRIEPSGSMTTYDYDSKSGRLLWEKDRLDRFIRYDYNLRGKIARVWGDVPYPLAFIYDTYDHLTELRTFREQESWSAATWPFSSLNVGERTLWTYDIASGLVTQKTDAAGNNVHYSYNLHGDLLRRTWARGIHCEYSYDSMSKLLTISYSDGVTPGIAYSYNRFEKVNSVVDAAGVRNFAYNDQHDLISEVIEGTYNKTLNYSYTTIGQKGKKSGMRVDGTAIASNSYDSYGRLIKINDHNYTYLSDSNWIENVTRPNRVNTVWSYEPSRNLVTQVAHGDKSVYGYVNDAIGRRTSMSRGGSVFAAPDTLTYSYNDRNEVTGAVSDSLNSPYHYNYGFDSIGNRLNANLAGQLISYTSNNLNQYIEINDDQPAYDLDGNMLTKNGWSLTWDGENRLVGAQKDGRRLIFCYDYMGRRIAKKLYEESVLKTHILFVYDGYKLIEELDALNNNIVIRRYTWQSVKLGFDVPLSIHDAANDITYFYHTDANKNVTELTDAAGEVVAHYEYSPFGQQTAMSGDYASENPFRFSSEYYDTETQLIYYNYRYYDPQLGRWLKRDPIEERGGYNLYGMVNNQIVSRVDQLGLWQFVFECTDSRLASDSGWTFHGNSPVDMNDFSGSSGGGTSQGILIVYRRTLVLEYTCLCECPPRRVPKKRTMKFSHSHTWEPSTSDGGFLWQGTAMPFGPPTPTKLAEAIGEYAADKAPTPNWMADPMEVRKVQKEIDKNRPAQRFWGELLSDSGVPTIWCIR